MRRDDLKVREVWAKLRAVGLKHHPSTVRFWLETDDVTAPREIAMASSAACGATIGKLRRFVGTGSFFAPAASSDVNRP